MGSPNDREPNLMRFGLRHLFFFFSGATVLAALVARMGGAWPVVISAVALLVVAHVFSTFLGTRLRDTSQNVQRWKARPGAADPDYPVISREPTRIADLGMKAPPLAGYEKIGRWRNWCVGVGAAVGGLLGIVGLYAAAGDDVTAAGLGLGAVSCGVIGCWVSLLGSNFYSIARHTLRQASNDLARDHSRR
jgi:hypothetical protein